MRNNNNNNNNHNNNNNNNHQPRRNNNKRPPLTRINIRGWQKSNAASNSDGGVQSLCSWLEKKASRKIIKSYVQGDALVISVNPDDADRFLHLNGFTFANANIAVENFSNQNNNNNNNNNNNQVPNGPRNQQNSQNNNQNNSQNNKGNNNSTTGNNVDTSGADQVEAALIAVIQRSYHPGAKMLALDSLPSAAEFIAIGLHAQPASKVFSALFVCCETKVFETPLKRQQMVEYLTLRGNGLTTVKDCIAAAGTFNTIKGLDLSNNQISDIAELRYWRNRFPDLEHLVLANNPVESEETLRKLRTWYPKMKTYNSQPVEKILQLESPKPVDVPVAAIELLPNSRHPEVPEGSDFGQPAPGKPGDQVIREQMILRFSYETRLRLHLSREAITENKFDYHAALANASRLLAEGKIQDTEAFMWAPRSTN